VPERVSVDAAAELYSVVLSGTPKVSAPVTRSIHASVCRPQILPSGCSRIPSPTARLGYSASAGHQVFIPGAPDVRGPSRSA
jgi:hypothetical protein